MNGVCAEGMDAAAGVARNNGAISSVACGNRFSMTSGWRFRWDGINIGELL